MVATLSLMDVEQHFLALLGINTSLEHSGNTPLVQLLVDDGIGLGSSLNLPGLHPFTR